MTNGGHTRENQGNVPLVPSLAVLGVGFDIGMTYSGSALALRLSSNHPNEVQLIPSRIERTNRKFATKVFVPTDGEEEPTVGDEAETCVARETPGQLHQLFKRDMTRRSANDNSNDPASPIRLTTQVILEAMRNTDEYRKINNYDGITTKYTFSHPGRWQQGAKRALRAAIVAAGIEHYSVIGEPIATALGLAHSRKQLGLSHDMRKVFICDLGGGTLDLALVTFKPSGAIVMEDAEDGNDELGMSNLDKVLCFLFHHKIGLASDPHIERVIQDHLIEGNTFDDAWKSFCHLHSSALPATYLRRAEELKKRVCHEWEIEHQWPVMINNQVFPIHKDAISGFMTAMTVAVERAIKSYLRDAQERKGLKSSMVSHVFITGGGSALPGIHALMKRLFPSAEVPMTNPSDATTYVQQGAALFALEPALVEQRKCASSFGIRTMVWITSGSQPPDGVTPFTDPQDGNQYYFTYTRFLRRGEPVPNDGEPIVRSFILPRDDLHDVLFEVLEGESDVPANNKRIGSYKLPLPKGVKRDHRVMCCFYLDDDGLMAAYAEDPETKERTPDVKFQWH